MNRLLMDNAGNEYVFVLEFFGGKKKRSGHTAREREVFEGQTQAQQMEQNSQRLYEEILDPTLKIILVREFLKRGAF